MSPHAYSPHRTIAGRYLLLSPLACGGMATVHFGLQIGVHGMGRVVAIKRLHPHLAAQPEFVAMFLDEARIAARVRHPNVVSMLDVVVQGDELLLVMDYIHGESLAGVLSQSRARETPLPLGITSAIVGDLLAGLHAAHTAVNERGESLELVHRDVSPQNVMVGAEGIARVVDFGIAKAVGRLSVTRDAAVKGKVAYMAPEQLRAEPVSALSDVYAASVVLWECLTGRSLVSCGEHASIEHVLLGDFDPPSRWRRDLPSGVDEVVMTGLARNPQQRHRSAREMALRLDAVLPRASVFDQCAWLQRLAGDSLAARLASVRGIEAMTFQRKWPQIATGMRPGHRPRGAPHRAGAWAGALGAIVAAAVLGASAPAGRATFHNTETAPSPADLHLPDVLRTPRAAVEDAASPRAPMALWGVVPTALLQSKAPAKPFARQWSDVAAKDPCSVPYELDAAGHRRYIRACFRTE